MQTQFLFDDEYFGPRYRYGLHSRPLSPGAVPKGFIIHSDRPSDDFRHGTLDYPTKLPDDQAANFELVFIGEFDTEGYFSIKRTPINYCQVCQRDFISPELVYFAPIDNTIVCSGCAQVHQDRELRIYVREE